MAKTVKIAISLPIKEFQEIESIKKKENLSRSAIILEAIRQWKEARNDTDSMYSSPPSV